MDISLPPHLRRFVYSKLRTGDFATANDVVCEGLARYAASERERAKQTRQFQRAVLKGLASAKAGRLRDGKAVFARLERLIAETKPRRRRA